MESALIISVINGLVFELDGLVLRNKGLHDAPADEVGNGADAEHYHVGSGFAVETEEGEGILSTHLVDRQFGCPIEELTRAEVDGH